MANSLSDVIARLRSSSVSGLEIRVPRRAKTDLIRELAGACKVGSGTVLKGFALFWDDERFCLSHRGDVIGNWRQSGRYLVFENALGELQVVDDVARALELTALEILDHLPPAPLADTDRLLRV